MRRLVRRSCSGERRLPRLASASSQLAEFLATPHTNIAIAGKRFVSALPRNQPAKAFACSPDMNATIIRNGRVIDPANKRDEISDLYITDGRNRRF